MLREPLRIEPISRDLLYRKVAEAICRFISQNALSPGDRLPAERMLAEEFGAGRNTVREALRLLEKEGVLEVKPGKGAYVRTGIRDDRLQLEILRVDFQDLLEIKIWLERLAIRRAAERASREKLEALREAAEALLAPGEFSLSLDRKFHVLLLECGGSETLGQLVLTLINTLDNYSTMLVGASPVWRATLPYHKDLADALCAGDLEGALAAEDAIYQHDMKILEEAEERNQ